MAKSDLKKMEELFIASNRIVSDKVELDNLDMAKLVLSKDKVEVENEHGTRFSTSELSKEEIKVFIYTLTN